MNNKLYIRKKNLIPPLESIKEMVNTLDESLSQGTVPDSEMLGVCQELVIALGNALDSRPEDTEDVIHELEAFCECLYSISVHTNSIDDCLNELGNIHRQLDNVCDFLMNTITDDKKEIVFFPYKASMWDSLESVWMAARDDEEVDAYVVPIPYFDRNPDGSVKEWRYEGDMYPDYVPVISYLDYDVEQRHPETVFIHNPYDERNYVTSVHPDFYSKRLKDLTDELVYIPYYVSAEPDPENEATLDHIQIFATTPAVLFAHKVILQSEKMKECYVKILTRIYGEGTRKTWEEKILGLGSPKLDKVTRTKREDIDIPQEWRTVIEKSDGSPKKTIFYNTSLNALLNHGPKMITKIRDVFSVFYENRDDIALIWRPHPLVEATISSMRPELWEDYEEIVKTYKNEGWGIYDDTPDLNRTIALSDAYYGDPSSVVQLCEAAGIPCMIENVDVLNS